MAGAVEELDYEVFLANKSEEKLVAFSQPILTYKLFPPPTYPGGRPSRTDHHRPCLPAWRFESDVLLNQILVVFGEVRWDRLQQNPMPQYTRKLSTMNMLHTFSTQFSRVDCVVPYSFMSICSGTNILNISHSQFHHATHMQHFIKYTNNFTKCTATLQILLVKLDTRFQIQCNTHINSGR